MSDIKNSIKIAVRHPWSGAQLLASTMSGAFDKATWINRDLKLKFCFLFMKNLLDERPERKPNPALVNKVGKRSLCAGIRLLKRYPEKGLQVLVSLVLTELKTTQRFTQIQIIEFYQELLNDLFPEENS
jgi:hypothetical protein